jgi:hypothetical protein
MRPFHFCAVLFMAIALTTPPAGAQDAARDATRERTRQVLTTFGPQTDINVAFRQSTKQPYNFTGTMTSGLKNAESLEIVVSVTSKNTIRFSIYPHYKGGYINLGRVRDANGLMRKLLGYTDQNFLFWGADDTNDVFTGYSITLESGFPQDAIVVVLRSIRNTDGFVGQLRPFIDGSGPA